MDMNTAKLKKNAFRVTKERGKTASRIRIPGGHMDARFLAIIQEIAEKYGNGTVHITNRQGFEVPGIDFEDMPKVNALLQSVIEGLEINQEEINCGYPAAGTRNINACIGARVCPYGCYDTSAFAQRMEKAVFPNDLHFKIAFTGCHNDCAKVRMHDFGIIGMTLPQFDPNRCISCGACVKKCQSKSVGALTLVNFRPERDHKKCIGCGECVLACPDSAWTRSPDRWRLSRCPAHTVRPRNQLSRAQTSFCRSPSRSPSRRCRSCRGRARCVLRCGRRSPTCRL